MFLPQHVLFHYIHCHTSWKQKFSKSEVTPLNSGAFHFISTIAYYFPITKRLYSQTVQAASGSSQIIGESNVKVYISRR